MRLVRQLALPGFMLVSLIAISSCKSPEGAAYGSLAAVEINGRSFLEVARATSEVFQSAGFEPVPQPPSNRERRLVFDRPGNTGDSVLWGDWSGGKIWYRAKINFVTTGNDHHIVRCDAYRVLEK